LVSDIPAGDGKNNKLFYSVGTPAKTGMLAKVVKQLHRDTVNIRDSNSKKVSNSREDSNKHLAGTPAIAAVTHN
jgi:hypothetical protein